MAGPALRRSRRSTPKKTSTYNVGDVVEIYRGSASLTGRLAYNLTEGVSPNPRWLVTFDDQSHKDEELYEKALGKVLKHGSEGSEKTFSTARRARPLPSSHGGSTRESRHSGSSGEGEDEKKRKNKSVSFSDTGTPAQSDDSSSSAKKASAREQRSLRRQAKIDEEVVFTVPIGGSRSSKRRLPSSRSGSGGNINSSNKRVKGENGNEEVVKVKLLTGTLYLYRGLHRRAEFIRRV
mmetsp:Transcript_24837/g.36751  ORF Transcript_24837/g.36751 Transcript_24837/m.36751 type:complete len:236 (-) Transcript_24837:80-787(-)